ncbi:MAG: hypothetical protein UDO44_02000 [Prevotella sp.]|nr:hypothetical protein [Prevotella sp.]
MKRSLNILMALMLSLMVVYLSVGTTVMHCLRYDKVMVGTVAGCCVKRCMDHDCCRGKLGAQVNKHCMDVKQVKLSPTVSIQHFDFDAAPVFAGIVPALWQTLPRPVICSIQKARYWNQNVPHSPPRAYLALLNTLII